ncbi:MAG: mandelate racemase/muconate lactonizing enzyme family protein [Desulfobacterales bacterium]|nr:MAG: mandelate racemase/muconate lactonizing enzyme family protein [Desulfobacterales bacterium]
MNIKSVEWHQLYPKSIKEGWTEDEYVWPSEFPALLIKITAEDGTYGVGEASTQVWYLGETREQLTSVLALYAQALSGRRVFDIAGAHATMESVYSGGMPGSRGARSGVDMALYDLIGKLKGLPVYELLGGAFRTSLEMLTNLYFKTPAEMADGCKQFVDEGFRGLKIKVGDVMLAKGWSRANFEAELAKLDAAVESAPNDVYLDADANQGWRSPKWTLTMLQRYAGATNLSIEQPLPYDDIAGASFLRQNLSIPLILDESVWSPEATMRLIRAEACDRVVIKLNRVGGFYPASQIVALCNAANIGVSVDTNPYTLLGDTACCHLSATIPVHYPVDCEGHLSFITLGENDPFVSGVKCSAGMATIDDSPGLGVVVEWSKIP